MPNTKKTMEPERERLENAIAAYMTNGGCKSVHDVCDVLRAQIQHAVEYLCRMEPKLRRYAEERCNGYRDSYAEKGATIRRHDMERQVEMYVKRNIGCPCTFEDDPRGMQIRLHLRTEATSQFFNIMDGETSGVGWIYAED